jgi:hypothetical protein
MATETATMTTATMTMKMKATAVAAAAAAWRQLWQHGGSSGSAAVAEESD